MYYIFEMLAKKKTINKKDTFNREVVSIRLKPSDIKRLDAVAQLKQTTRTSVVEALIVQYLAGYEKLN